MGTSGVAEADRSGRELAEHVAELSRAGRQALAEWPAPGSVAGSVAGSARSAIVTAVVRAESLWRELTGWRLGAVVLVRGPVRDRFGYVVSTPGGRLRVRVGRSADGAVGPGVEEVWPLRAVASPGGSIRGADDGPAVA